MLQEAFCSSYLISTKIENSTAYDKHSCNMPYAFQPIVHSQQSQEISKATILHCTDNIVLDMVNVEAILLTKLYMKSPYMRFYASHSLELSVKHSLGVIRITDEAQLLIESYTCRSSRMYTYHPRSWYMVISLESGWDPWCSTSSLYTHNKFWDLDIDWTRW